MRPSRTRTRAIALTIVAALLVAGCGSTQDNETGAVTAETVKQLEDVLHARASAMAKGDRNAFLATIDTTRPAFRRVQLREFDYSTVRGTFASSFRISNAERYRGYIRGFVEESLDGAAYAGIFHDVRTYVRRYFRTEGGKWILTEPAGDETGPEKKKVSGDVEITYSALDEDVSDVLLSSLEEARKYAQVQTAKSAQQIVSVKFIPTAEIAGPGWDGFAAGDGPPGHVRLYPSWWGFNSTRTHVSADTDWSLRRATLAVVRESVAPAVSGRLFSEQWLDEGWYSFEAGNDVTGIVRQSCTGVAIPTFREIGLGFPPFGQPGIAPEANVRYFGYATSMVAYLYERYGADAYWKLMTAYLQSASAAVNFPRVLQVTPDEFYADWLVWLKKKYC